MAVHCSFANFNAPERGESRLLLAGADLRAKHPLEAKLDSWLSLVVLNACGDRRVRHDAQNRNLANFHPQPVIYRFLYTAASFISTFQLLAWAARD